MRIHHFTIPADDPPRVAAVLAGLLGARVAPISPALGTLLIYAGDADGSGIEVWPATLRAGTAEHQLTPSDLPLPQAWPHHAYVTSDACNSASILAAFAREGWKAEHVHNGPPGSGFGLVRGWIENRTCIELGGEDMRREYERFVRHAAGSEP